jgi:cell division protein FtsZ
VDIIAINTDKKALDETAADKKIYICKAVTKGEGTKGDAGLGRNCAEINRAEIEEALIGHDAVFIIAGLGGGTGTGAAPVVAEICRSNNMMTIVIGINPFSFETERIPIAKKGVSAIRQKCPYLFTIENEKVLESMRVATLSEAMREVNKSIMGFVKQASATLTEKMIEVQSSNNKIVYSKDIDISSMPKIPLFSGV